MASESPAPATNSKGAVSCFYPNDHHREKLKQYESSCHCGTIQFKFLLPPLDKISVCQCNCSICDINGYLNVYPFAEDIEWVTSKDTLEKSLGSYRWNSKKREHHFCKECGTSLSIDFKDAGNTPDAAHWAINARTIKGVDWRSLKLEDFDGRQFPIVDAE